MAAIDILLLPFDNPWTGQTIYGYDLQINDPKATIADYLDALDSFAAQNIADCLGCDGCCHERAPLTAADMQVLATLLPAGSSYHDIVQAFAQVDISATGEVDIMLKRGEDEACLFLDQKGKSCTCHLNRPFVCRSHFCLPKSQKAEDLRSAIVNCGEDELILCLLAEEQNGKERLLTENVQAEDYPLNGCHNKKSYGEIYLQDLCSRELWSALSVGQ